jgi:guanylate kinase
MAGRLVIISGPSAGAGKDTILKLFLAKHPLWVHPPSVTTRPLRPGEQAGIDMNVADRTTFQNWLRNGKFLEAFEIDGNWYGSLRQPLEELLAAGTNVILRKDVRGALLIKALLPAAATVFIRAEDEAEMAKRIRARHTESEEQIAKRLELAQTELGYQSKFDYVIVNPSGHPELALTALERAVLV